MSENRYTFKTCSELTGICVGTIQYRAAKLEIDTKFGISASELKRIEEYPSNRKGRTKNRGTLHELKAEMEALG